MIVVASGQTNLLRFHITFISFGNSVKHPCIRCLTCNLGEGGQGIWHLAPCRLILYIDNRAITLSHHLPLHNATRRFLWRSMHCLFRNTIMFLCEWHIPSAFIEFVWRSCIAYSICVSCWDMNLVSRLPRSEHNGLFLFLTVHCHLLSKVDFRVRNEWYSITY